MPGNKGGNGKPGGGGGEEVPLYISGNKKDNVLFGGNLGDWINGKEGNDTLHGGGGNDELLGADGNDILYGDAGNDELGGGDGDDRLYGGEGNDVLHGGMGADVMDGGDTPGDPDEHDIASFVEVHNLDPITGWPTDVGLVIQAAYDPADLAFDYLTDHGDRIVNVEEIQGTNYNDIMFGRDDMADYFVGARGNDVIVGGDGGDTLYGSLDDDVIYVGEYDGSIADIQAGMLDETMNLGDNAVDTLIFLRVADRYFLPNGDVDFEYVFGDGVDTVYGFDPMKDKIHFISDIVDSMGNEIPDFDAELLATQDGDNTVIEYAPGSAIILVDVDMDDINASHFSYEFMDV